MNIDDAHDRAHFAAEPKINADIESTLVFVFASVSGMKQDSQRTRSVLTTWLGVHPAPVNTHRLLRRVDEQTSGRVCACGAAIAHWRKQDRRFARLGGFYDGPPVELLEVGTEFQIQRRGEDGASWAATRL